MSESIVYLCLSGVARQREYPASVELAGGLFVSDQADRSEAVHYCQGSKGDQILDPNREPCASPYQASPGP